MRSDNYTGLQSMLAARLRKPTTCKNLIKWCIGLPSACSICLQSKTLQHVGSSWKSYFNQGRYTWRHDSFLNFIANTLPGLPSCTISADFPAFLPPSLVACDSLQPELLLITNSKALHNLELTIGFETNMKGQQRSQSPNVQSSSSRFTFKI